MGFKPYFQRWCELVGASRGGAITHLAYRMDEFDLGGCNPVQLLREAATDTEVNVVLSPHGPIAVNGGVARKLRNAGVRVHWSPTPGLLGSMHIKATSFSNGGRVDALVGSADMWSARLDGHRPYFKRTPSEGHEFGVHLDPALALTVDAALQQIVRSSSTRRARPATTGYPRIDRADSPLVLSGFPPPGEPASFVLEQRLADELGTAQSMIYIEDQYFALCHPSGWTSVVLGALCDALARGAQVAVVLPSRNWRTGRTSIMGQATSASLATLIDFADGSPNLFVGTRRGKTDVLHAHSKVLAIDGRVLVTGSANLCRRSFKCDSELTLFIRDRAATQSALRGLLGDAGVASNLVAALRQSAAVHEITAAPAVRTSGLRRFLLDRFVDAEGPAASE